MKYYIRECLAVIRPDLDEHTIRQYVCDAFALSNGDAATLEVIEAWQEKGPYTTAFVREIWRSLRTGWEINSGYLEKEAKKAGAQLHLANDFYPDANRRGNIRPTPALAKVAGVRVMPNWANDTKVVNVAEDLRQSLIPDALDSAPVPVPLVEGLLDLNSLSVTYGPSGCGKTFFALDLANSIANGSAWNGSQVSQGLVLYVAAEGFAGLTLRLRSLREAKAANLQVMARAINLLDVEGEVMGLLREIKRLEGTFGPTRLIVFDTLARCLGDGDENSSGPMKVVTEVAGLLSEATGAHVMLVHHSGKVTDRGMRGHSSLFAACDTVLRLKKSVEATTVTAEKQKDRDAGLVCAFKLKPTEGDGGVWSSAQIEFVECRESKDAYDQVKGNTRIALDALTAFLETQGEEVSDETGEVKSVIAADLASFRKQGANAFDLPDTSRKRRALDNAISKLEGLELVMTSSTHIWLNSEHS